MLRLLKACTNTRKAACRFYCEPLTLRQQAQQIKVRDFYLFGSCEQGQLGQGTLNECTLTPKRIKALETLNPLKVVIGHNHSAAILKDGSGILMWGYNQYGQLGLGTTENTATPSLLQFDGHTVTDVACGPIQTFVMTKNNRTGKQAIWHFGAGYVDQSPTKYTVNTTVPLKVKKTAYIGKSVITKIVPGGDFCLWIDENHQVYSFGANDHGGLGNALHEQIAYPTLVHTQHKIVDIAIGWGHAIALTDNGEVLAWGSNLHGQCGLSFQSEKVYEPKLISYFSQNSIRIKQICCGETHSLALDTEGRIYSWGSYKEGKLGYVTDKDGWTPRMLESLEEINIQNIAAGTDHSAAVSDESNIFVWGFGQHGALSFLSEFNNAEEPLEIPAPNFRLDAEPLDPDMAVFHPKEEGFDRDHKDYPFFIDGQKVSEGHFFDEHYDHRVVGVQCGMDMTVFEVVSTLKE